MNTRKLLALGLTVGLGALIGAVLWKSPRSSAVTSPPPAGTNSPPVDLGSSLTCKECHPAVYQEWEESFHAQAYLDPLVRAKEQANNFRKEQCLPCHAPGPVLEHGIGKGARVVERVAFREHGVDCLSCHRMHDQIAGTRTVEAPCQPVAVAELSQAALCAPCHNQHDTVIEWEESSYHDAGVSCNDCHMPPAERVLADGSKRMGRSHRFPGAHDRDLLIAALDVATEIEADRLIVRVTNTGAGHNYPTDARHRALDLVVTLRTPDGIEVPAREPREPGQEPGTARRRFRNPYRGAVERLDNLERYGRENTQILAGETIVFEVPYRKEDIGSARIEVIYKLTPLVPDAEGTRVFEQELEL